MQDRLTADAECVWFQKSLLLFPKNPNFKSVSFKLHFKQELNPLLGEVS